ncbi:MAG: hypothetical protein GX964_10595 [Syntrophomonadaceae bacterium]|jgi:hypothetical protein|nr:hypothetical protein [Syntrophomonadaceae bacterium]
MPKFYIPITFRMSGAVEIEANSLEEAENKVLTELPYPEIFDVVDNSVELDKEAKGYGKIVGS